MPCTGITNQQHCYHVGKKTEAATNQERNILCVAITDIGEKHTVTSGQGTEHVYPMATDFDTHTSSSLFRAGMQVCADGQGTEHVYPMAKVAI